MAIVPDRVLIRHDTGPLPPVSRQVRVVPLTPRRSQSVDSTDKSGSSLSRTANREDFDSDVLELDSDVSADRQELRHQALHELQDQVDFRDGLQMFD